MANHQGEIIPPVTMAMGPVFVSVIILYSFACDAIDVMDDDNLVTSLTAQIQVSILLIGIVRKSSVESMV